MHVFTLLCLLLALPAAGGEGEPVRIALQPLGAFDATLLTGITDDIADAYQGAAVRVLPAHPLPDAAYYKPRNRYRAEKLLAYLDSTAAPGITKTVGLTAADISTTKGEHDDWGIFGLGSVGGAACVVSTFRLRSGNASPALLKKRLTKTVVHELGHTVGLQHCTNEPCTMNDAQGSIRTVDDMWNGFCDRCRKMVDILVRVY